MNGTDDLKTIVLDSVGDGTPKLATTEKALMVVVDANATYPPATLALNLDRLAHAAARAARAVRANA